jgi:hypothetical protein
LSEDQCRLLAKAHKLRNLAQVVVHQGDVCSFDRGIGSSGAHGKSNAGLGQGWRVIYAVTNHADATMALQFGSDDGKLILRQEIAAGVVDADLLCDRGGSKWIVPSKQKRPYPHRMQLCNRLTAGFAYCISHRNDGQGRGFAAKDDDRLALAFQPVEDGPGLSIADTEFLDQAMVSKVIPAAIDLTLRTLPVIASKSSTVVRGVHGRSSAT